MKKFKIIWSFDWDQTDTIEEIVSEEELSAAIEEAERIQSHGRGYINSPEKEAVASLLGVSSIDGWGDIEEVRD